VRASILLLCSLVAAVACGQAGASSPTSRSSPVQAPSAVPTVDAELTLDVLELI